MRRILVIPIGFLVLLIGAMFWSGGGTEKRADFAFINRGDIHTLDLNQMSYMQDFRLTYGIREGLYDLDPKTFRPIPAGAIGFEPEKPVKEWTFHLRPGCKWSNGDPVTARDYIFSWRRMLEEPGEYTYLFNYMHNAGEYKNSFAKSEPIDFSTVGMTAVDDLTLKVTLDNPVTYLLDLLAFPPFYPRNERSMAAFRMFVDTDVMDLFERCVDAAKQLKPDASPTEIASDLQRAAGLGSGSFDPAKSVEFAAIAKTLKAGKDPSRPHHTFGQATEAEILAALAVFAKLDPLRGKPAEKVDKLIDENGEGETASVLDGLTPAVKLDRLVKGKFLRYTYNKAYTLPPDVVTNGAFTLAKWDFKRRLVLEKSATYWDKANVKSNSVEMVVAESPQSQLLMYQSRAVDWQSEVSGEQASELKKLKRTDLRVSQAFGTMFISLMCSKTLPASAGGAANPMADVRVRQALAMAIDKKWIVDNITRMGELPARTYLPPDGTLPDFVWQPGIFNLEKRAPYTFREMQARLTPPAEKEKAYTGMTGDGAGLPYDPDRARKLLAEAGYAGGKNFPTLPLLFNTSSPARRDIAQRLKNQWREELGINITLEQVEGKIFQKKVSAKDYVIATVAWYGDYPDMSTFTDKYHSESLQNDSGWKSPAFDRLLLEASKEADPAKRVGILSRAEHMIDTESPIIPIYHYVNVSLNRDNVKGVEPNPRNITNFKYVSVEGK